MKKALITGITGQDGSYLTELLLKKGYEVHGVVRRSSSINTTRIDHMYSNSKLTLHYGDMSDSLSLDGLINLIKPDEIYNLAAQSHVHVSFQIPEYTGQVDALGTLKLIEAVKKHCPNCKIYNATTSELYGKVQEIPQTETTPFYPRSPYGVAKLYSYWISKNYRESYNMFISNGILFNHETSADFTPMIFKIDDEIDIKPISEIVKYHTNKGKTSIDVNKKEYQGTEVSEDLYVWDKNDWTKVKFASGYPHDIENDNKNPRFLISKNASYLATSSHKCIMEDESEKTFGDIEIGDKVNLIEYPIILEKEIELSEKESELIGFIVGDGNYNQKRNSLRLTGKETNFLEKYSKIWEELGGDVYKYQSVSGFNENEKIWQYDLNSNKEWNKKYLNDIYDEYNKKRVPKFILNSNKKIQLLFLKGYNNADGLKSNSCKYEFKNFKTNSHTLSAGLIYLLKNTTGQDYNINIERKHNFGEERIYYSINILSDSNKGQNHRNNIDKYNLVLNLIEDGYSQRKIQRETGISRTFIRKIQNGYIPNNSHHLEINKNTIKKIIEMKDYDGWFFDLETESGTFHAGVGQGHIHNSERRGETFVTRKITIAISKIVKGTQEILELGNLDSKRDWGYAPDYVEGMWRILQSDKPDDFVLATNETHSIREFIEESVEVYNDWLYYTIREHNLCLPEFDNFQYIDLEWRGEGVNEVGFCKNRNKVIIKINPKYYRPAEVDLLLGDPTKAKDILGWEPKTKFKELVEKMMIHDLNSKN